MKEVFLYSPSQTAEEWPEISKILAKVTDRYPYWLGSPDVLLAEIVSGLKVLWVTKVDGKIDVVMVSRLHKYPKGLSFIIVCLAGKDGPFLDDELDLVCDYAKSIGCNMVELWGRRGWKPLLKEHHFDEYMTNFVRKLS